LKFATVDAVFYELEVTTVPDTLVELMLLLGSIVEYVDAAYCYRPSSVVCQSVTVVSPVKTAELIEMPFLLSAQVDPRNHVLGGGAH